MEYSKRWAPLRKASVKESCIKLLFEREGRISVTKVREVGTGGERGKEFQARNSWRKKARWPGWRRAPDEEEKVGGIIIPITFLLVWKLKPRDVM